MRSSTIQLCAFAIISGSLGLLMFCHCKDDIKAAPKSKKLPKDPLFITDVDLEHLYDEWEESDDEKLPDDELPPHKRPQPKMALPKSGDTSDIFKNPEKLLEASKKGKTVMAFANIAGHPTKDETEAVTQRWQVGLGNAHIKAERYVIAEDRVIFVFHDGQQAFDARHFILDQPECKEYSIDQKTWQGKGFPVDYPHASGEGMDERTNARPASAETESAKGRAISDEL